MTETAIIMPQLGESIAEATIIEFLVRVGDVVTAGQDLIEVETQKAAMNVTAPCGGVIASWKAEVGASYAVGEELGLIQTGESAPAGTPPEPPPASTPEPQAPPPAPPAPGATKASAAPAQTPPPAPRSAPSGGGGDGARVKPTVKPLPVPAPYSGANYMSPRMKARMHELGLREADLAGIAGSGAGGRLTVQDLERFLSLLEETRLTRASSMRVAVADAMRRSWTRPLATVGLPVNLDALLAHRAQLNPKPGPALFALRALALALAEDSAPAGRLIGNKIAHPASIDIGFAVEAEDGVLVPVLRHADKTPISTMVDQYNALVAQARQRKLPADATGGSVATVTNFGTFGLTWATPIPLPEQSLVLGMGAGRKAPWWNPDTRAFEPVTEANLTLSFDHRVIDGGAAGRLLMRIRQLMESPGGL